MSNTFSRRGFLTAAGAVGVGGLLAACGGSGPSDSDGDGGGGGSDAAIRWWDHFGGFQDLHKEWATTQTEALGHPVEYTYNQVSQAAEALQLAQQASQLPDIYSNVLGLPLSALVEAGWLAEIPFSDDAKAALPEGSFVEGITTIDGKVYGMPLLSDKQYWCCTWFNTDIQEQAGFEGPTDYDGLLAALRSIADLGDDAIFPMTLALGDAGRMRDQINDLAQYGGFPGYNGQRYDTGAYNWDHDSYVNAIELFKEINDNGWLIPGTNQFAVPDARSTWAAGGIGFFFDGPWSPGGVRNLVADFVPLMGTSGILTPNGEPRQGYRGAPSPVWFMAKNSPNPDIATQLLESFTTEDYLLKMTAAMDQPPLNLDIVAEADVTEPYKFLIDDFTKVVYRAPEAVVRKPEVSAALGNYIPVDPHLGSIIQGYLAGEVSDLRGDLAELNGKFEQMVDDAVEKANADGSDLSRADWEFPDWTPGQDYTY
jgi:ABC-type glycerol-3-phosphate transport system substrate-binding protein